MLSRHVHLIALEMSHFGMDFSLIVASKEPSRCRVLETIVAVLLYAVPRVAGLRGLIAVLKKDLLVLVGDALARARLDDHVDVTRPRHDGGAAIPKATVIHDREEGEARGCGSVAGRGLLRHVVAFVIARIHI